MGIGKWNASWDYHYNGVGRSIIRGGAHIHIFVFALLIPFEIDCFCGLWTWIYEYEPPPPNYRSSYAVALENWTLKAKGACKLWPHWLWGQVSIGIKVQFLSQITPMLYVRYISVCAFWLVLWQIIKIKKKVKRTCNSTNGYYFWSLHFIQNWLTLYRTWLHKMWCNFAVCVTWHYTYIHIKSTVDVGK